METLKRNLINLGKGFIVWFILLLLNTRSNEAAVNGIKILLDVILVSMIISDFQKVQAIMNKKKSKNKKQDKQSEKPVPRKKEEEQIEGTGRNSAQNPCYGLLVCTGISYIYCLDFKNKNPGSYFNTSVSLGDHY